MDKWEYEAYIYDWGSGQLEVRRGGSRRELTWNGMWSYFNDLGEQGWEMLSVSPVSDARWGNAESNTTRMIFVFKRPRIDNDPTGSEPSSTA